VSRIIAAGFALAPVIIAIQAGGALVVGTISAVAGAR
jgi:hypothetical protein